MDNNPVIIFGAGGLGKAALEIIQSNGMLAYCFLDDDESLHRKEINDVTVMGKLDDDGYLKYIGKKCEACVAIADNSYRRNITRMLIERRKVKPINVIHKLAYITDSSSIGYGNFVNYGAIVGAGTVLKDAVIIHAGAIIDYGVTIEDYVQIGAGSIVNSGVTIGEGAFIGSGVTLVSGLTIGKGARIGAGSVVIDDVKEGETVFGNPAKPVGPT